MTPEEYFKDVPDVNNITNVKGDIVHCKLIRSGGFVASTTEVLTNICVGNPTTHNKGQHIMIDQLKKGDLVVTRNFGKRPSINVTKVTYAGTFLSGLIPFSGLKVILEEISVGPGSDARLENPFITVSPDTIMLVHRPNHYGTFLIPAEQLEIGDKLETNFPDVTKSGSLKVEQIIEVPLLKVTNIQTEKGTFWARGSVKNKDLRVDIWNTGFCSKGPPSKFTPKRICEGGSGSGSDSNFVKSKFFKC